MSLLTFKALNDIAPNYLCSKIERAKTVIIITPEEQLKIISRSPHPHTKFGMRTFAYRTAKVWNDLPNELLEIISYTPCLSCLLCTLQSNINPISIKCFVIAFCSKQFNILFFSYSLDYWCHFCILGALSFNLLLDCLHLKFL